MDSNPVAKKSPKVIKLTILSLHPCIAEAVYLYPTCVCEAGNYPDLVSFFVTGLSK